jgi:hypothetical protein
MLLRLLNANLAMVQRGGRPLLEPSIFMLTYLHKLKKRGCFSRKIYPNFGGGISIDLST